MLTRLSTKEYNTIIYDISNLISNIKSNRNILMDEIKDLNIDTLLDQIKYLINVQLIIEIFKKY
jgi:uncharacterized protein YjgD (DUF1641 family)